MHFSTSDIAAACAGRLIGDDVTVNGVSIDSRSITPGQLFVPIVAERDGHDFVAAAVQAGAGAYLASRPIPGIDAPVIEVADTAAALMDLGRAARRRITGHVVAITGSVGKTSTKDLLAEVLRTTYRTAASERSFNNELGLPLTLCNADDDAEVAVLEMGARGIGHIELLCSIASPTVGVVTRVDGVHLEMFGSIEAIAAAKGEIVESLPADGFAVLNALQPEVRAMASRTAAQVLMFDRLDADVRATGLELDDGLRPSFLMHTPWGDAHVQLAARGDHQVANALAATAAAGACGVPLHAIVQGLAGANISGPRMDLQTAASGALVLNDAYNANPTSMRAALRSLEDLAVHRRIAVLGQMSELGPDSDQQHLYVAAAASRSDITVIAVDAPQYGDDVRHVAGIDGAVRVLNELAVGAGDAVLVKASRVAALERVAEQLLS